MNYAYTIPHALATILIPIFPNTNWFGQVALEYTLWLVIFLFVNYENVLKIKKHTRKQIRKENPIKAIPYIIVVILLVCFIAGFMPYKPVAIISNSMVPEFKRGDICIVKQVSKPKDIQQIKQGDIIEYEYRSVKIVHRVIKIDKNGNSVQFYTKGDNNLAQDILPVEEEQIIGIVKNKIPYLGYPSVWFSEIISK